MLEYFSLGGLPDSLHVVSVEDPVVADDGQILTLRLRDQHSIKRVPMLPRQTTCAQDMRERYWPTVETKV